MPYKKGIPLCEIKKVLTKSLPTRPNNAFVVCESIGGLQRNH